MLPGGEFKKNSWHGLAPLSFMEASREILPNLGLRELKFSLLKFEMFFPLLTFSVLQFLLFVPQSVCIDMHTLEVVGLLAVVLSGCYGTFVLIFFLCK